MKGAITIGLWLTAALLATVCGGGSAPTPLPTIGPPSVPPAAVEVVEEGPGGSAASGPTPSPASEVGTSTAASVPTAALGTDEDVETIRRLAFDYWTAFNDYDKERVLSYLEDSYRAEREGELGKDIGRLKLFSVKLGVSQLTPPRLTGVGEGEMVLLMEEPLGTRQIRMAFRKIDGEWKITHAEEEK